MRICSGAGCLRVIDEGTRFCDECKPSAKPTDEIRNHTLSDRIKYAFLYSSTRWTRLRNAVAREQPFCVVCRKVTEIIDHVVPAGVAIIQASDSGKYVDRYAGFFLKSNLRGLCRQCHYTKTEQDKAHVGAWKSVIDNDEATSKRVISFG